MSPPSSGLKGKPNTSVKAGGKQSLQASLFLGLLVDPEDGGEMLFRNDSLL
jgi:hypothetical protein